LVPHRKIHLFKYIKFGENKILAETNPITEAGTGIYIICGIHL